MSKGALTLRHVIAEVDDHHFQCLLLYITVGKSG